jgi:hypothetical protein
LASVLAGVELAVVTVWALANTQNKLTGIENNKFLSIRLPFFCPQSVFQSLCRL